MIMIEWFKNLSEGWQTAIFGAVVAVGLTVIGGLFALIKWLFRKKDGPSPQSIKINTGIDPNNLVDLFGKTKEELGQANERIRHLEEQLAKLSIETIVASEKSTPMPSAEAKELAKLITENDGPYAQALKAIAEGNNKKADGLLDETQKIIDQVQQRKNEAQTKIYVARMQNASYAGRPQDALQYCNKLKPLAGEDSQILNDMAAVYYENADYQDAEPLYKRALVMLEKSLGENHPQVATALNNMAALYQATNRLSEAEPLFKRALAIDEASFGKDYPNVATYLNNLAQLYQDTNRLSEAEPLMKRALAIWEKSLGENHPQVATALNNLAALYQATNRLSEAEPLMKRAVEILENPGGEPLPNYAGSLNNLAELYRATNRFSEAEPLYKRALAIDEARLGKDHPDVAIRLNNLAQLYQDTNRLSEAEPLTKRALAIDETSFGKDHPNVARDLNNLALLYKATNRFSEAEPMYKRAVEILTDFTRRTGHPHPRLQNVINNYASLLRKMGYSEDEVIDRLKRLAPEMFKQKQ